MAHLFEEFEQKLTDFQERINEFQQTQTHNPFRELTQDMLNGLYEEREPRQRKARFALKNQDENKENYLQQQLKTIEEITEVEQSSSTQKMNPNLKWLFENIEEFYHKSEVSIVSQSEEEQSESKQDMRNLLVDLKQDLNFIKTSLMQIQINKSSLLNKPVPKKHQINSSMDCMHNQKAQEFLMATKSFSQMDMFELAPSKEPIREGGKQKKARECEDFVILSQAKSDSKFVKKSEPIIVSVKEQDQVTIEWLNQRILFLEDQTRDLLQQ